MILMLLFLFCFFSTVLVYSCFKVISVENAVFSVLYLILGFCNASGVLFLLEVEFISLLFLIVYVGAIAVLFLFVVMILNVQTQSLGKGSNVTNLLVLLLVIFLATFVAFFVSEGSFVSCFAGTTQNKSWFYIIDSFTNVELVGNILYTYYCFPFLLAGFVLLVAIVGAIILTLAFNKKNIQVSKKQRVYQQLSRTSEKAIFSFKKI